jgi:DNA-binding LytR/AlgR family response regulator
LEKSITRLKQNVDIVKKDSTFFIQKRYREKKEIDRVLIRDGNLIHVIKTEDIFFIQAQDDYVAIKTNDKVFLKLERMSVLENQLPENFKRIHRSYIANINFITRIEDQKNAVLNNGQKIPVSRSGYTKFFK